jgi:hypothetical protein
MPYLNHKSLNILKGHQICIPKTVWNNQKRYPNELHLILLDTLNRLKSCFRGFFTLSYRKESAGTRWMRRVADHHIMVCQEMLQNHGRMSSSVRMCGRNCVQSFVPKSLWRTWQIISWLMYSLSFTFRVIGQSVTTSSWILATLSGLWVGGGCPLLESTSRFSCSPLNI